MFSAMITGCMIKESRMYNLHLFYVIILEERSSSRGFRMRRVDKFSWMFNFEGIYV